jgi:hypothetical protein
VWPKPVRDWTLVAYLHYFECYLLIRNSLIPIDEQVIQELEQISKLQIKNGKVEVARLIGAEGEEITLYAPLIEILK